MDRLATRVIGALGRDALLADRWRPWSVLPGNPASTVAAVVASLSL
jgi:hypothetical protein